jgi:hypothetical protein
MPRAGRVPNGFFLAWGVLCAALLGAGGWLLYQGLHFRAAYEHAEGSVVLLTERGTPPAGRKEPLFPFVQYQAGGHTMTVPAPRTGTVKELARFKKGKQVELWYRRDNPHEVWLGGDSGPLPGVLVLAVGGLFLLAGLLAAVAEFFPGQNVIRFGE